MFEWLGIKKLRDGKYEVAKYSGFYVAPDLKTAFKYWLFL